MISFSQENDRGEENDVIVYGCLFRGAIKRRCHFQTFCCHLEFHFREFQVQDLPHVLLLSNFAISVEPLEYIL